MTAPRDLAAPAFSLAELQLMLGAALARERRFAESARAFDLATAEGGTAAGVLAALAAVAMRSGERDLALWAQLELALHDPEHAERPVLSALELLDAPLARAHGAWILDEWRPRIRPRLTGPVVAESALLAGEAALLLDQPETALQLFAEAGRLPSGQLGANLRSLATEAGMDPWTVAQACATLGLVDDALASLDELFERGDPALELQARELAVAVLESEGRNPERALFELGRAYDRRRRHADAVGAFERAAELSSDDPVIWWYLADARRLTAGAADLPVLERAWDEWKTGLRLAPPTADYGWVYLTGALLIEVIGSFTDLTGESLWLAALQVEQALALLPADGEAWTMSARYHRSLGNDATALHAADRAVALGGHARIEQLTVHVVAGAPGSEALLARAPGPAPGRESQLATLDGMLRVIRGDLDGADAALAQAVSLDPENLWALRHRLGTSIRRGASDEDSPTAIAERALAACAPEGTQYGAFAHTLRGLALLVLDRGDEAVAALRPIASSEVRDGYDACVALAAASQLRGDGGEATTWMERADARAAVPAQVELTRWLLDLADSRGADTAGLRALHERTAARLADRELDAATATAELERVLERALPDDAKWLVATAALARLDADRNALSDAVARYEELVEHTAPVVGFPAAEQALVHALKAESRLGTPAQVEKAQRRLLQLGKVSVATASTALAVAQARAGSPAAARSSLEAVTGDVASRDFRVARLRLGDLQLAAGELEAARATYDEMLAAACEHGDAVEQLELRARLGVLAVAAGRLGEAAGRFRAAIDDLHGSVPPGTAEHSVMWAAEHILGLDRRPPALAAVLRGLAEDPTFTPLTRRRLSGARFAALATDPERAGHPLKPILIEIAPGLLDEAERDALRDLIPQMRARIRSATGIRISGVGVRESRTLGRGKYGFLIEEIPRDVGRIPEGSRFVVDSDPPLGGRLLRHPFTGATAEWVRPELAGERPSSGTTTGVLWHLEGLLRLHLARFIGLSEVTYLLDEWESEADGRVEIVDGVLHGKTARIRLTWILRALVRGHVPVDDLESILRTLQDADGARLDELVERARRRAHHALADVVDGRTPIDVPDELIGAIELDRTGAQAELRAHLAGRYPGAVFLTVEDPDARPSVQRAVERVWPSGAVLSQLEAALVHVPGVASPQRTVAS